MRKLTFISVLVLLLGACAKREETKIVPMNNPVTTQSVPQLQAEGTINGGGGKGVRCKKDGASSVETLDLYEAKVLYGLEIEEKVTSESEALDLVSELLSKHFWNPSTVAREEHSKILREAISNDYLKKIKFINRGKKLKLVNDSFEPLIDESCEMVQVAVYYDESILLVDQELWDQMNWTSKISLLAHEMIYFMDRENGSKNSMAARKLVGQLFSTKGTRPKADGVPIDKKNHAACWVSDKNITVGYFYAFDSSELSYNKEKVEGLEFVFNFLKSNGYLFRTSAFFRAISLKDVFSETLKTNGESPLTIESYKPKQSIYMNFLGSGKGTMRISNSSNFELSEEYEVRCQL